MPHCAIRDFLENSTDLVVSLHIGRYNGLFMAIIAHESRVDVTIDTFENTNGVDYWHLWGMSEGWYPWGNGDSSEMALNNLRSYLECQRVHWDDIRFGIEQVTQYALPISKRITSRVITMDHLVQARKEWNDGSGAARFF
jgi:hypothetical protein